SAFLIVAISAFTASLRPANSRRKSLSLAVLSGLFFASSILCRSEVLVFLSIFVLVAGCCSFLRYAPDPTRLRMSLVLTVAAVFPFILFCHCLNALIIGQFRMTTAVPFAATSTVYNLFDKVEPRDHVFGEIMQKYYRGP